MKKQIITLFLILFSSLGYSQFSSKDQVIYLDSLKRIGNAENYKFLRIIKDYHLDKDLYDVTVYYKSGKLEMKGTTSNKDNIKLEGSCEYYFENENRKKIANYTNNKLTGKQFEWYNNGKIKSEIEIIRNKKNNTEKTRVIQFWDEDNTNKVINGEGEYIETDFGNTVIKGEVKNALKEGKWVGFSQKLKINFIEYYSEGILIEGISTDSLQVEHKYKEIKINAKPKKGMDLFYNFIGSRMKIPVQSNKVLRGTVYLSLIIDATGKIKKIKALNKDDFGVSENAIKTVSKLDEWIPAYFRGIPIEWEYILPIVLK